MTWNSQNGNCFRSVYTRCDLLTLAKNVVFNIMNEKKNHRFDESIVKYV